MGRITEELLRKRSEHNEGQLHTLREIALHQYELERIEVVGDLCRELEILLLQNNVIPRIENVNHLKQLRYLNLALNNIERIENLEGCESLEKLDLTVNFVADLLSIESLKSNYNLRDLFLMGNPCTEYDGYRLFVIQTLPQVQSLDSQEITRSERIRASQEGPSLRERIQRQQEEKIRALSEENEQRRDVLESQVDSEDLVEEEMIVANTPEDRLAMAREISRIKEKKENVVDGSQVGSIERLGKQKAKLPRRTPEEDIEKYGRIMQRNEGKWDFRFDEDDPNSIRLHMNPGKFLDTSLIDIDLHPTYIRMDIKGKILQLILPDEIIVSSSQAQRSAVTGELVLTMPRTKPIRRISDRIDSLCLSDPNQDESSSSQQDEIDKKSNFLE